MAEPRRGQSEPGRREISQYHRDPAGVEAGPQAMVGQAGLQPGPALLIIPGPDEAVHARVRLREQLTNQERADEPGGPGEQDVGDWSRLGRRQRVRDAAVGSALRVEPGRGVVRPG